MTSAIKKYQIFCTVEEKWSIGYSVDPPVFCYNVKTHTVNPDSVQELEMEKPTETKLLDEAIPTGSNRTTQGYSFTATANNSTNYDITFDTPVDIFQLRIQTLNTNDVVDVVVDPNASLGAGSLTQDAPVGSTAFKISEDKIGKLYLGLELVLSNGTTANFLGKIISIDSVTHTVTTKGTSTTAFLVSNTIVKTNQYIVRNYVMINNGAHTFPSKNGALYVPKGTIVRCAYKNNGSSSTTVGLSCDYAY